jgi:hypothetical protein
MSLSQVLAEDSPALRDDSPEHSLLLDERSHLVQTGTPFMQWSQSKGAG